MVEFYGFKPRFKIGDTVRANLDWSGEYAVGRVVGISFEEFENDVYMFYDVDVGRVMCFEESQLSPVPTVDKKKKKKAKRKKRRNVDYTEYTVDQLLDAYNVFKSLGFEDLMMQITDELKRR